MFRRQVFRMMTPKQTYDNYCQMGVLQKDPHQEQALQQIERLWDDLYKYFNPNVMRQPRVKHITPAPHLGYLHEDVYRAKAINAFHREQGILYSGFHPLSQSVKGLYLWGGVGCGKTYLMDLLYDVTPTNIKKSRVHFHQFMLDVHKTMHFIRQEKGKKIDHDDVFEELCVRMIGNIELLCFDEMIVNDIVDATILKRLFHSFYRYGLVCMFTSNRAPTDLYKNGLNRELFTPFIDVLQKQNHVWEMEGRTDYRMVSFASQKQHALGGLSGNLQLGGGASQAPIAGQGGEGMTTFFYPNTETTRALFEQQWTTMTHMQPCTTRILKVFGRDVIVELAVGSVCRLDFHETCDSDKMSVADFGVVAKSFHTIFIENIPQLDPVHAGNVCKKFISLIDELYQHHCKVIFLSDVTPKELNSFAQLVELLGEEGKQQMQLDRKATPFIFMGTGALQLKLSASPDATMPSAPPSAVSEVGKLVAASEGAEGGPMGSEIQLSEQDRQLIQSAHEEIFQLDRCISRIMEMQTDRYLQEPHNGREVTIADRL